MVSTVPHRDNPQTPEGADAVFGLLVKRFGIVLQIRRPFSGVQFRSFEKDMRMSFDQPRHCRVIRKNHIWSLFPV